MLWLAQREVGCAKSFGYVITSIKTDSNSEQSITWVAESHIPCREALE